MARLISETIASNSTESNFEEWALMLAEVKTCNGFVFTTPNVRYHTECLDLAVESVKEVSKPGFSLPSYIQSLQPQEIKPTKINMLYLKNALILTACIFLLYFLDSQTLKNSQIPNSPGENSGVEDICK